VARPKPSSPQNIGVTEWADRRHLRREISVLHSGKTHVIFAAEGGGDLPQKTSALRRPIPACHACRAATAIFTAKIPAESKEHPLSLNCSLVQFTRDIIVLDYNLLF
jgi:hypothetical protein